MNQGSNYLEGNFSNKDNVRVQMLYNAALITPVLLEQPNEVS